MRARSVELQMTQSITGKIRERITGPHYLSEFGLGLGLGHDREQSLQSGVPPPANSSSPHPLWWAGLITAY